tara:strand:- start:6025 stop:6432 length:408 start_codon:yes stop_codon:yes gene_type:complete
MLFGRSYARLVKPQQSGSSRSIPLPMLTDGPYSIVEVSSGGRRRNDKVHLPQYVSGEELESLVQGKVGGRVADGQGWETPPLWEKQGEIEWERISEVPSIYQSIKQNSQDLWKHVEWGEEGSDEEEEGEEAGSRR